MDDTPALWGAFGIGFVLGWCTQFTNRHRDKTSVQLGDLAVLLGVIGGAAVTSLFGEASGVLFANYGIGLLTGFLSYLVVLVVLVLNSKGEFTLSWFLDGRSQALRSDQTGGVTPLNVPDSSSAAISTALIHALDQAGARPAGASSLAQVLAQRDAALLQVKSAMDHLSGMRSRTQDLDDRARYKERIDQLAVEQDRLLDVRLQDIADRVIETTKMGGLKRATADLTRTAAEMKRATDAYNAAAAVIAAASSVVDLLITL